MEGINDGAITCHEGYVRSGPYDIAKTNPEECLLIGAVAGAIFVFRVQAKDSERPKRLIVERLRAFDVAHANRYVIQHFAFSFTPQLAGKVQQSQSYIMSSGASG